MNPTKVQIIGQTHKHVDPKTGEQRWWHKLGIGGEVVPMEEPEEVAA